MIKSSRAVLGAALLAIAGIASAATTTVSVDAQLNSAGNEDNFGGYIGAEDTGVQLITGQSFSVIVQSGAGINSVWNNDPAPQYTSDANGHSGDFWFSSNGQTFETGSLVGRIGDTGSFFKIGTAYSATASATGELELFYWDNDAGNNSGALTVDVTAVPEPANIALLGLALGAFALSRRRKA